MSGAAPTLAVIGAINVDLVVAGATLPGPGQTVVGGTFAQHDGGQVRIRPWPLRASRTGGWHWSARLATIRWCRGT